MGPLINRSVVQNAYVVNDLQEAMDRWTKVFNVGPWLVIPVVEAEDMRYYGEPY